MFLDVHPCFFGIETAAKRSNLKARREKFNKRRSIGGAASN
jgi:hypothetical protein